MKVALYCRVSTEEQAKYGFSIKAQLSELREYAKKNKYVVVGEYLDEGVSGGKLDRPALNKLLNDIPSLNIKLILFVKLDRWFRSVAHYYKIQETLEKYNVSWKTTQEDYETETSSGNFKVNIMLSVSQQFKDATSERIKSVMDYKAKNKMIVSGKKILGYDIIDRKYVINEEEAKIIKELFNEFICTGSLQETYQWYISKYDYCQYETIKRRLKQEKYAGRYNYHGTILSGFIPQIIDDTTFNEAQRLLGINCKKYYNRYSDENRIYLFSGLLVCPCCGGKLIGWSSHGRWNRYRCKRHNYAKDCNFDKLIREDEIEEKVLNMIPSVLNDYKQEDTVVVDNSPKIKEKINHLQDLFIDGLIDKNDYKIKYDKLQDELIKATPIKKKKISSDLALSQLDIYNLLDKMGKRTYLRSIISSIEFKDNDIIINLC